MGPPYSPPSDHPRTGDCDRTRVILGGVERCLCFGQLGRSVGRPSQILVLDGLGPCFAFGVISKVVPDVSAAVGHS